MFFSSPNLSSIFGFTSSDILEIKPILMFLSQLSTKLSDFFILVLVVIWFVE